MIRQFELRAGATTTCWGRHLHGSPPSRSPQRTFGSSSQDSLTHAAAAESPAPSARHSAIETAKFPCLCRREHHDVHAGIRALIEREWITSPSKSIAT